MKTAAIVGGVLGGVFVGALIVGLFMRRPRALQRLGAGAKGAAGAIARGFREGYHGTEGGSAS